MKARLFEHTKREIQGRYIMEIKVWALEDGKYPVGFKYSLLFFDTETKRRILMDNHYPKGPHTHIDHLETDYQFKGVKNLLRDFEHTVIKRFGVKI